MNDLTNFVSSLATLELVLMSLVHAYFEYLIHWVVAHRYLPQTMHQNLAIANGYGS